MNTTTCVTDEGTCHTDFADTGTTGVNPLTGDTFQIWTCACGQDHLEVFPTA